MKQTVWNFDKMVDQKAHDLWSLDFNKDPITSLLFCNHSNRLYYQVVEMELIVFWEINPNNTQAKL